MMQDEIRQREEHGWLLEVWPNRHALMTDVCSRLSQRWGSRERQVTVGHRGDGG